MKLSTEQRQGVYRLAYALTWKGLRERLGCGMDRLHAVRQRRLAAALRKLRSLP